jgi:hypothetical protein
VSNICRKLTIAAAQSVRDGILVDAPLLLLAELHMLTGGEFAEGVSPLATVDEARELFGKMGAKRDLARARQLRRKILRTMADTSGGATFQAAGTPGV